MALLVCQTCSQVELLSAKRDRTSAERERKLDVRAGSYLTSHAGVFRGARGKKYELPLKRLRGRLGPTTPDQKTKRTTLRKSTRVCIYQEAKKGRFTSSFKLTLRNNLIKWNDVILELSDRPTYSLVILQPTNSQKHIKNCTIRTKIQSYIQYIKISGCTNVKSLVNHLTGTMQGQIQQTALHPSPKIFLCFDESGSRTSPPPPLPPPHRTSVISRLCGAISLFVFNKSLSNMATSLILGRYFFSRLGRFSLTDPSQKLKKKVEGSIGQKNIQSFAQYHVI